MLILARAIRRHKISDIGMFANHLNEVTKELADLSFEFSANPEYLSPFSI